MTITRLGQICGEMRCLEEFNSFAFSTPAISSTVAKTGTYSIYRSSYDAMGVGFLSISSVRAGLYSYATTGAIGTTSSILYLSSRNLQQKEAFGIIADFSTKTLGFYIDGASVGTIVHDSVVINEWHHYSIVYDGTNGILKAYLDSETILNLDMGVSFAYPTVNGAWAGSSSTTGMLTYTDDMYVDEVTGADIHAIPPRKFFMFKSTTGPGSYDDWTPVWESANWRAIDEPTAHDGDDTYNKALFGSLTDTFATSPVSIPADTSDYIYLVKAVIPQLIVKRNNVAQDAGVRMISYDGGTLDYGDTEDYLGPGYEMAWHRYPLQPDNSPWNETDINNMEFGYQSQGTFT